jgi:Zn-dependent protease with chaperone function
VKRIQCPHCQTTLKTGREITGQVVRCPSCNGEFTADALHPSMTASTTTPLDAATLRDAKEGKAFGWLMFCASLFCIPFILSGLVLWVGPFFLVQRIMELMFAASLKTNAVQVSESQFPEIHAIAENFSKRIGQELPSIYIAQNSVWNAFAARLAGKRFVVLLSGAVDSILLKGSHTQLAFVVGHELGHHYAGHLDFWRSAAARLGSLCIWVRFWYSRRCEFTADRYGLACADSAAESMRAVCNMAVGAQLAQDVDIEDAIAQWDRYRSEFFVKYRTFYSTHPPTLWRLQKIVEAASQLGIG